jgi:hypothetical protein
LSKIQAILNLKNQEHQKMLKKSSITFFLFVGLNIISIFSNYSMGAQEPQKSADQKSGQALEEYYKANPWKFIEQKFMVEPDQLGAKKKCSLLSKETLAYASVVGIALIADLISIAAFNIN